MRPVWVSATLAVLAVGPAGVGAQEYEYGWSLSRSATTPDANVGPPTAAGELFDVHLWLICSLDPPSSITGVSTVELAVQTTFVNHGLTLQPGVLNAGDQDDLLLAMSCRHAPSLLGTWTMEDTTGLGGQVCMAGIPLTVECGTGGAPPSIYPSAVVGFGSDGNPPCTVGTCARPTAVERTSWARTRVRYR